MSKKHLPALWEWIVTVEKDVKSQIMAFNAGVKSKAQQEVERAAARAGKPIEDTQETAPKKKERKWKRADGN